MICRQLIKNCARPAPSKDIVRVRLIREAQQVSKYHLTATAITRRDDPGDAAVLIRAAPLESVVVDFCSANTAECSGLFEIAEQIGAGSCH
jgi:hypothetical protein